MKPLLALVAFAVLFVAYWLAYTTVHAGRDIEAAERWCPTCDDGVCLPGAARCHRCS